MGTTQERAAVDVSGIEQELNDLLLDGRSNTLPHVLNGRSKAPSDSLAARYRKDIVQSYKHPFRHLYTISACDLRDGVPFSEVVAPYRRLIALLEVAAVAGALQRPDRPIPSLVRRSVKEISELTVAEMNYAWQPESDAALETLRREAEDVAEVLDGITTACDRQLALSRGTPRPQYGQRLGIR